MRNTPKGLDNIAQGQRSATLGNIRGQFAVPPSGGVTPPEGGTTNLNLVYSLLEIA
ncbi:hypothetical protein QUF80_00275 [Desulfococcaceae bacterium HSG8]|nr:hypothetical protein [Desulfococcaceae bacterium HSG8]